MAIPKRLVTIELTDGTLLEDMRILFADRLTAERTFVARKWDMEKTNVKQSAFLGWLAAKRLGHTQLSWEDFEPTIVDVLLEIDDGTADDEDPTEADTSAS